MAPSWAIVPSCGAASAGMTKFIASGERRPSRGRPERDAGDDFADHRRLSDVAKYQAEDSAEGDDRSEGEQDVEEDMPFPGAGPDLEVGPHGRDRGLQVEPEVADDEDRDPTGGQEPEAYGDGDGGAGHGWF